MRNLVTRSALLGAILSLAAMTAGAQTHVYTLNNTYTDLFGGPSLTPDGTSGVLSSSGYTFNANDGLTLSNVFTAGASYSIAFQSTLTDLNGYRKMVDFKDRVSDNGYYSLNSQANFYNQSIGPVGTYAAGVQAFTVLTRDAATDLFSFYVNGVLQNSFIDTAGDADFTSANGVAHFFEDDAATGFREASAGNVNYIAVYDVALTQTQVANLTTVTATPEPASIALLGTGLVGLFGVARRRKTA